MNQYQSITILLCFIAIFSCKAQSISPRLISSAGSQTLFQEVNIHWSVGEVAVSHDASGVNVSEGFHQANVITTSVMDVDPYFGVSVYPNPTTDRIAINHSSPDHLRLHLYNSNGQLLLSRADIVSDLSIDLSEFIPGAYILSFLDRYGHIESHQVIIQH